MRDDRYPFHISPNERFVRINIPVPLNSHSQTDIGQSDKAGKYNGEQQNGPGANDCGSRS